MWRKLQPDLNPRSETLVLKGVKTESEFDL